MLDSNCTTIRTETGDSQYWQDRKVSAMEALSARMGISAMSAWFDTLPARIRGGCDMTLALTYEKKLDETPPALPICDLNPDCVLESCDDCQRIIELDPLEFAARQQARDDETSDLLAEY